LIKTPIKSTIIGALMALSATTANASPQESKTAQSFIAADLSACVNGDLLQARIRMETTFEPHPRSNTELEDTLQDTAELREILNTAFRETMLNAETGTDTISIMDNFITDTSPDILKQHFNQTHPNHTNFTSSLEWSDKRWVINECTPNA